MLHFDNILERKRDRSSVTLMKKGQGLSIETIILAILVLVVLVVLILIFTGKIGEWRVQTEEVGSLERLAGGEQDSDQFCLLEDGPGTCRRACTSEESAGKQSATADQSSLCKFGLFCCKKKSAGFTATA